MVVYFDWIFVWTRPRSSLKKKAGKTKKKSHDTHFGRTAFASFLFNYWIVNHIYSICFLFLSFSFFFFFFLFFLFFSFFFSFFFFFLFFSLFSFFSFFFSFSFLFLFFCLLFTVYFLLFTFHCLFFYFLLFLFCFFFFFFFSLFLWLSACFFVLHCFLFFYCFCFFVFFFIYFSFLIFFDFFYCFFIVFFLLAFAIFFLLDGSPALFIFFGHDPPALPQHTQHEKISPCGTSHGHPVRPRLCDLTLSRDRIESGGVSKIFLKTRNFLFWVEDMSCSDENPIKMHDHCKSLCFIPRMGIVICFLPKTGK